LSNGFTEDDFELHLAEFFPRCPLCGSVSMEFDVEFGRKLDFIHCLNCQAKWEVDWKGEDYEIEYIKLVEVKNVEQIKLKGKEHIPKFWLAMANKLESVPKVEVGKETQKIKEIIREKEVIVKIRCPYCGFTFNEHLDKCPNCGGHR